MRGRPTLRFMGTVRLSDVWMDKSGGVVMDIHPNAMLTRIYFENLFCLGSCADRVLENVLRPVSSKGKEKEEVLPDVSGLGIKIALGDTDGPETTYMVIFAKMEESRGAVSACTRRTTQLVVARLTTRPPDTRPRARLPRPDDPIPRKPPLFLFGSKVRSAGTHELKRAGSSNSLGSLHDMRELKRVASVGSGLASDVTKKPKLDGEEIFKVPVIPAIAKVKRKGRRTEDADVFGLNVANGEKARDTGEADIERLNKNMIKKTTLDVLVWTKDPKMGMMVGRSHPEFKEIFQWVYRGVSFALRARMKSVNIEAVAVQYLVKTHVDMYVGGHGSMATTIDPMERTNSI